MPEYQFANRDGSIVSENYDGAAYFSADQVLQSLSDAFSIFPFNAEIKKVENYDDVFHVTFPDDGDMNELFICGKGTTPGGRKGLKDEQRIQPKAKFMNYVCDKQDEGKKGVFLGVYSRDGQNVFCTWKVARSNASTPDIPISKQIKITSIAKAIKEGFVQQDKGQGEYACAFKPEFLFFYLKNSDWLHNGVVSELAEHTEPETEESSDFDADTLTPEWFNEKGKAFLYLDDEAAEERERFLKKYAPEVLRNLEGLSLLRTIFLNDDNKDNLCYELEFEPKMRELFGSIKSGTAYKYGLHYSKKNQKWATGSGRSPQFLSVDEAIELGTQIRDYLVEGADIISRYNKIDSLEGYSRLYKELNEATDGYVNRVWFLKYYQMIAPALFPPIYSQNAQTTVIKALGEKPDDNAVVRMGQMQLFVQQCDISAVVFSRTFWANYDRSDDSEEDEEIAEENKPIRFKTGLTSVFERNRILFGAPGTGKSYTVNKEAKELIGENNETDYERVTFHPDYSYANFVGTYKPVPSIDAEGNETITYEYVPGPFMRVYVEALKNGRTENVKPYLLIIEEINRANVAAVFGDIFQLLDRDDNISEYPIQTSEDIKKYLAQELGGLPEDYLKIRIPDNMFIWATMNSADQGVFPMDTAFKRRWEFTYLGIDDADTEIRGKYVEVGSIYRQRIEWNSLRKAINDFLAAEKINEDKQLGPYFISRSIEVPSDGGNEIDSNRFCDVFKHKILMYLFDDAAKQKRSKLFEGSARGQARYSAICKAFDEQGIGIFHSSIQNNTDRVDLRINGVDVDDNDLTTPEE